MVWLLAALHKKSGTISQIEIWHIMICNYGSTWHSHTHMSIDLGNWPLLSCVLSDSYRYWPAIPLHEAHSHHRHSAVTCTWAATGSNGQHRLRQCHGQMEYEIRPPDPTIIEQMIHDDISYCTSCCHRNFGKVMVLLCVFWTFLDLVGMALCNILLHLMNAGWI